MKILVSNDDGYRSRGIRLLREALASLADVTVVAPDRNRSGASNSLTLDVPLRVLESEPGVHYVQGTPTDCVHLAISGLFDFEHDMVVSGINDGANLGDDVLYSGTVAAAIEGRFLGLPAVAISLCTAPDAEAHFETAARVARQLVAQLVQRPLEQPLILNVNVPDLPFEALRGLSQHAARIPPPLRAHPAGARSARPGGVLGRARGTGAGRRAGHRFRSHRPRACFGDAAADRSDAPLRAAAPCGTGWISAIACTDPCGLSGIGMTSARTRDRLVQRLREQGITDPRCSIASATCRGTSSSMRRSAAAPMRTPPCRSASARPSRSPTSSRA